MACAIRRSDDGCFTDVLHAAADSWIRCLGTGQKFSHDMLKSQVDAAPDPWMAQLAEGFDNDINTIQQSLISAYSGGMAGGGGGGGSKKGGGGGGSGTAGLGGSYGGGFGSNSWGQGYGGGTSNMGGMGFGAY